jgi:hypothetical protein
MLGKNRWGGVTAAPPEFLTIQFDGLHVSLKSSRKIVVAIGEIRRYGVVISDNAVKTPLLGNNADESIEVEVEWGDGLIQTFNKRW